VCAKGISYPLSPYAISETSFKGCSLYYQSYYIEQVSSLLVIYHSFSSRPFKAISIPFRDAHHSIDLHYARPSRDFVQSGDQSVTDHCYSLYYQYTFSMSYFNNNNLGGGNDPRRNAPSPGGHGQYDPDPYHDNSDIYSQYSQPSFVSNKNGNNLTNRYQANANAPPSSYTPAPTAYSAASYTSNPTGYTAPGPGDYFAPAQAPTAIQPRPSFSSTHHPYQDYDDTKSYASSANLNKEWGVGQVVPPVPTMPINQGYPPRNPYAVSPSAYAAPQTPGGTAHWHQVRNQLMERRVVKQIPLINGNLVMDVPVPKGCITGQGGLGCMPDEMEKMRYSAATCDPDDFQKSKFSIRPYLYGRRTELFVSRPVYPSETAC